MGQWCLLPVLITSYTSVFGPFICRRTEFLTVDKALYVTCEKNARKNLKKRKKIIVMTQKRRKNIHQKKDRNKAKSKVNKIKDQDKIVRGT